MDPLGTLALLVAAGAGAAVAVAPTRPLRWLLSGAWILAFATLAYRFSTVDLRLSEVAALTRDEVPWGYRVAGAWAGPRGSALTWFAIAVPLVSWRAEPAGRRAIGAFGAIGAAALLVAGSPFERLDDAVVAGIGLNPVLEHPLMLVHPPLLYLSQAMVLTAAAVGTPRLRRWTLLAAGAVVSATALGSWWAHDELGWGGYWAWDPVENTALVPLVALIAAAHATSATVARRWVLGAATAVLAGIALTRSGLPSSVHAFASDRPLGTVFFLGALGGGAALVATWARPVTAPESEPSRSKRFAATTTSVVAALTATVLGAGAVAAAWLGTRDPRGSVDGSLIGLVLIPVGALCIGGVASLGFRRTWRPTAMVCHIGLLLLAGGVTAGLWSTSVRATLDVGETARVGSTTVHLIDAQITADRGDLTELSITAELDGRLVTARVLDHPDIGRTRARPSRITTPLAETELVAMVFSDDRARIEVRRAPGLPLVWTGAATMAIGLFATAVAASGAQSSSGSPRRRRDSSSEPSGDPASNVGAGSGGGTGGGESPGSVGAEPGGTAAPVEAPERADPAEES